MKKEEYIAKAEAVHGKGSYDYSKLPDEVICKSGSQYKIPIICPIHGEFEQNPCDHSRGHGCPKCSCEKSKKSYVMDYEEFVKKANKIHNHKFDYSKTDLNNRDEKGRVCITCFEHGDFWQKPNEHLKGHIGCKKCNKIRHFQKCLDKFNNIKLQYSCWKFDKEPKRTNEKITGFCEKHQHTFKLRMDVFPRESGCIFCLNRKYKKPFIETFNQIKEQYPQWKFDKKPISIGDNVDGYCIKHDKKFKLRISDFTSKLNHGGCPICTNKKEFIRYNYEMANKALFDKYGDDRITISEKDFVNAKTKSIFYCKYHGFFEGILSIILSKNAFFNGCPACSGKTQYTNEKFIEKAREVHGDKYDYSKVEFKNTRTKVCITCSHHGEFWQSPCSHLQRQGCPICNHGMSKSFKLSLLEEVDLELMSENQLLELIKMGNLPKEFKTLIFSKPKSKKRKDDAKKLKEKYSDETKSEEETNKEIEEQIQEEEKKFEENNNNEQEDFALPELTEIQDIIDRTKIFDVDKLGISHGEGEKFIINSSLHELWNTALNSGDKFINQYKSETNTGKWFNCIRDMFFDEYNKVNSFIVDENCKFPYKPNLMQKLMVYKMKENNYYGNWSDAGAGKSFSRELTSRAIDSHVSLYIVPNAVKDTTKKSILEAYPNDSNIVFIENINDIVKLDETKYNYMIINYDKFQQEHTMDWINKLVETNKIDFICLDEIQNVKVRNINDVSIRNTMIRTLIENVKHINPNVKLLALSATPIINNLTEVRMLMELLTGNEYKEIGNKNTIENIHEAYKALLLNGFRFVPEYTAKMNPISICVNGDALSNDLMNISNSDISKIEQMLAELKIDECIKKGLIKDKTIIYTHYVDGIVPMLRNEIESLGLKVDCYTGEEREQRKDIIDNFINGNLNVLIGSRPISTGVDGLQKVCNNMIIISAPWTNAEYHQLIKRIYRQGSLFKDVDVIIPKVYIDKWSWDERRIEIIEHKKTLGEAVLDGSFNFKKYDEDSFRTKLLSKAIEALNQGLEDKDVIRKKIEVEEIDIVKIQRSESYVNEIHRVANISKHENISKNVYGNDKNKFNEYHKHRQESIKSWVENPINYVADIINNRNEESYHYIIDMGCGLNQLKDLIINGDKRVVGVDFYSDDKNVIQSDMCDLNKYVPNKSKDICVFCLSLWGTNYEDYIKEANRIMKHGGILIIVEPYSKFGENKHYNTIDDFSAKIEKYGFEVLGRNTIRNNFVYFKFHKI